MYNTFLEDDKLFDRTVRIEQHLYRLIVQRFDNTAAGLAKLSCISCLLYYHRQAMFIANTEREKTADWMLEQANSRMARVWEFPVDTEELVGSLGMEGIRRPIDLIKALEQLARGSAQLRGSR